jgi:DNA-binding MarR family transcriptional regulator
MQELRQILKTKEQIPLSRATVISIMHSHSWMKDGLLACLKPFDLSIEQFNVLRILRGQKDKAINLQDIQERMVNKMSNTTRLVDKLISKSYVKRTICKDNRRKVEIVITQEGLTLLKTIDPLIDAKEAEMTSNLNIQELEILNTLLLRLKN